MVDARRSPVLSSYECAGVIDEKGQLQVDDLSHFRFSMKRFPVGLRVSIKVEELKDRRSNQANRYYWGAVLREISEHTGYEVDELHEYFKKRFNPKTLALGEGEEVIGGSTRKLDTAAFREYVERIRRFAASELGVVTPDPEREVA